MNRISCLSLLALLLVPNLGRADTCGDLFQGSIASTAPGLRPNRFVGLFTDTRSGRKSLSLAYPTEPREVIENGVRVLYYLLNVGSNQSIRYDSRMLFSAVPARRVRANVIDMNDTERRVEQRIVTIIAARQAPKISNFPESPGRFQPEVASLEIEAQRLQAPPEYVAERSDGKMVLVKEILEERPE